ncbi:MAG TPA: hypothetical protein VHB21_22620 [Minicystis sp.]|nr:hypothetical protein [Minicystis sp.]
MSDYRDERDALRARAEVLEQALADKEREIARLREDATHPLFPPRLTHELGRGAAVDDVTIDALMGRAWRRLALFAGLSALTIAFAWALPSAVPAAVRAWSVRAGLAAAAVSGMIAIVSAGRPLQRRTGFDVDFMVSRVWLPGFMGLVIPVVPVVDCILRLASSSFGGYTTSQQGGANQRHYPEVALPRGEGKPLGFVFLAIMTVWTGAIASTLYAWNG